MQVPQYVSVPGTPHEPLGDVVGPLKDVMPCVPELQQYDWTMIGGEITVPTGATGTASVWVSEATVVGPRARIPQKIELWQPSDVWPVPLPQL